MATHLKADEREFIAVHREAGRSIAWLSRMLGRARCTISREFQRNGSKSGYSAHVAQQQAERRHAEGRRKSRKMLRPELRPLVLEYLRLHWSPEQIAGALKQRFPANKRLHITGQTIYTWIATDDHSRAWKKCLRRHGVRKRRIRTTPKARPHIKGRPAIINERGRYGDWEGDTIVSPRNQGGALVSLVERRSGLVELISVPNLQTKTVTRAIHRRLLKYPPGFRLSITFDNGKEFADYEWLKEHLQADVYFAAPRSPWQRGTNEHTNGLVREYFPKGTHFNTISEYAVAKTQDSLNNRPRKRLDFQTPSDILQKICYQAIQT